MEYLGFSFLSIFLNEPYKVIKKFKEECNLDPEKESIFIIGSLTRDKEIAELGKILSAEFKVTYVEKHPERPFEKSVEIAFDNVESSDVIIAFRKKDGSLGQGTIYEMEYARRLNKKIIVIDIFSI